MRWTWWDWSLSLGTLLQCFDTVGWVIWPAKTVPEMTYNVFSGTLNPTHSLTHSNVHRHSVYVWPGQLDVAATITGVFQVLRLVVFTHVTGLQSVRTLILEFGNSYVGSRPSAKWPLFSYCLSVCLFVCAEFFSAVFDPISIKLGHVLYVWV